LSFALVAAQGGFVEGGQVKVWSRRAERRGLIAAATSTAAVHSKDSITPTTAVAELLLGALGCALRLCTSAHLFKHAPMPLHLFFHALWADTLAGTAGRWRWSLHLPMGTRHIERPISALGSLQ
jgi:hypothetical protein